MAATAQVTVLNSQQVPMLNTVLIHVALGTGVFPLSEVFYLGDIAAGNSASASPAFGAAYVPSPSGSTPADYWTLLFSNSLGAGFPLQTINAIPPTVSNIVQSENGQTIQFNVESDGECAISNPAAPDPAPVKIALLGSSTVYAFLSAGQYQSGFGSAPQTSKVA
jgi:hypothetical protein